MDQNEKEFFVSILNRCRVALPQYPNAALRQELENIIKQLKGLA
jgi:hypothetical protein